MLAPILAIGTRLGPSMRLYEHIHVLMQVLIINNNSASPPITTLAEYDASAASPTGWQPRPLLQL